MRTSLLLLVPAALAWDQIGHVWPADAMPVPIALAGTGDLDPGEVEAALEAAIATWNDVDCASVELTYAGRAGDAEWGEVDGVNAVFVLSETWPADASLLSSPSVQVQGADIAEADIALNARDFVWVTRGADGSSRFDLQAGLTHELGHALGLWHSAVTTATLNPAMAGNPEARTLEDDDIEGLCTIYSGAGAGAGLGEQGEACFDDTDCLDDHTCLVDGEDRYCAASCAADADCADGTSCVDVGGDGWCAVAEADTGCDGCATGGGAGGLALLSGLAGLFARRRRDR